MRKTRSILPTCSIEAVSRASGDTAANATDRVDEDRKAHAECDQRDPHAVSEAEDEYQRRDDRDGRDRPRKLDQRIERTPGAERGSHDEPDGDADRRSDREAGGEPPKARCDLRQKLARGPDLPRLLDHVRCSRHQERSLRARPDLPQHERAAEDGQPEKRSTDAAEGSAHAHLTRSSPLQCRTRRSVSRSATLIV